MSESILDQEGLLQLNGEITHGTTDSLIKSILEHNLARDREIIRLYINSPGGQVDQGFALLDIMAWSRIPIHTTGMGTVASMALLILMAGARGHRTVMPRCSLLSHRFSTQVQGTHADLLANRVREDMTHRRIIEHYTSHTKMNTQVDVERELLRPTDRWLSPEEALEFGIVDRVWSPTLTDPLCA